MLEWPALTTSVIMLSVSLLGCGNTASSQPAGAASATTAAAVPTATASASAVPAESAAPQLPEREIAGAQHVLVSYKGAELADKTVARTKADAKKRAEEALGKIKKDKMPFEEAAKKYSDDPRSKSIGGALGNFEKNVMPEAFSRVTFSMAVGDVSDVVETPRGFHIIKRTR